MADTYVTYVGNGTTDTFSVPFPFIHRDHVEVYENGILLLTPADYTWLNDSSVKLRLPPSVDNGVEIRRTTPVSTRLVDFQNGAVLTEAELDLAFEQNFYLIQEIKENYSDLVDEEKLRVATGNGLVDITPPEVLAALVDSALNSALASELQARITDIDDNAESILDNAQLLTLIGDANGDRTAFVLDGTTVQVDGSGTTFAAKITALEAADSSNSASITTISSVTIPAIQADLTAAEGDITAAQGDISALEARYGVSLNVNGYITGFEQFNDGSSGTFQILADKFYVVNPASGGIDPVIPFGIVGTDVYMQNVFVGDNVIVDGAVTADKLEANLVLGTVIATAGTGNRVELAADSDGDFPFWIGNGTKGTVSGSPGSGARVFYDSDADQFEVTGSIKAETFSASAFTPISEVEAVDNGASASDYDPNRVGNKVDPIAVERWAARYSSGQSLTFDSDVKDVHGPDYSGGDASAAFRAASRYTTMMFEMTVLVEGDVSLYLAERTWNTGTSTWGSWVPATTARTFASHGAGVPYAIGEVASLQPAIVDTKKQYRWSIFQATGDTGYVHAYWGHLTKFNLAESP